MPSNKTKYTITFTLDDNNSKNEIESKLKKLYPTINITKFEKYELYDYAFKYKKYGVRLF